MLSMTRSGESEYSLPQRTTPELKEPNRSLGFRYLTLAYLFRERRSTAPTSKLIPNENVLSRKGTLRL